MKKGVRSLPLEPPVASNPVFRATSSIPYRQSGLPGNPLCGAKAALRRRSRSPETTTGRYLNETHPHRLWFQKSFVVVDLELGTLQRSIEI